MSVKDFILQGLTAQSHSAEIKKMFSDPSIEHAIVSVAFLTSDGISQLKDIFLNIRQRIHTRHHSRQKDTAQVF